MYRCILLIPFFIKQRFIGAQFYVKVRDQKLPIGYKTSLKYYITNKREGGMKYVLINGQKSSTYKYLSIRLYLKTR